MCIKNMKKQLLYYAVKYQGDYKKITNAINENEDYEEIDYNGHYITILDDRYPKKLFRLSNPPYVLFYEGNIDLLNDISVAVIGSRVVSDYGVTICKQIVSRLKMKYCICSGLALGIDGIAHKEAINDKTIGILGCGINVYYPKAHKDLIDLMKNKHLILSEYPNHVKPLKHHFPMRNRIIAALSKALVVCEAKKKSGTMITVNEALGMNIPIYCIPHNIDHSNGMGCNLLIQQGANIIVDDYDIDAI